LNNEKKNILGKTCFNHMSVHLYGCVGNVPQHSNALKKYHPFGSTRAIKSPGWLKMLYHLDDRLLSMVDGLTTSYSLDLAGGLTQVLAESNGNAYLMVWGA
jgi:hypothetical protein